jgi:hypothetical protein
MEIKKHLFDSQLPRQDPRCALLPIIEISRQYKRLRWTDTLRQTRADSLQLPLTTAL